MVVRIGSDAPDFTLKGTGGETFTLSDTLGKKRTLLVFYPVDQTPGCRNQLSAIGESIDYFRALDTEPYGVNEADAASHQRFIDELNLPFDLLIDEQFEVADAYGCLRETQRMNARTVIIVGKNGKVIYREAGSPEPAALLDAISTADDESPA
jgi:thioredoxin-dependent peroxiredoxin